MLSRSVGHAHSWRPGVGMRALCPFLEWARDMSWSGADSGRSGHVRAWARALDMSAGGRGAGLGKHDVRSAELPPGQAPGSGASRGPAGSARTAVAFPPCPRQPGRSGPSGSPGPPAACAREDWARRHPRKWSRLPRALKSQSTRAPAASRPRPSPWCPGAGRSPGSAASAGIRPGAGGSSVFQVRPSPILHRWPGARSPSRSGTTRQWRTPRRTSACWSRARFCPA